MKPWGQFYPSFKQLSAGVVKCDVSVSLIYGYTATEASQGPNSLCVLLIVRVTFIKAPHMSLVIYMGRLQKVTDYK